MGSRCLTGDAITLTRRTFPAIACAGALATISSFAVADSDHIQTAPSSETFDVTADSRGRLTQPVILDELGLIEPGAKNSPSSGPIVMIDDAG